MRGFYRAVVKPRAYLLRPIGSAAREKTCCRSLQIPSRLQEQSKRTRKGESVGCHGWFNSPLETWRALFNCAAASECVVEPHFNNRTVALAR
jgi:hypothetical protein